MTKLFLGFTFLWVLVGNPFIALLILFAILYMLDRRFVGLTPNIFKPIQLSRKARKYKQELYSNPHYTSAKHELARILIERKKYNEALKYLEETLDIMKDSADVHYELGLCYLKLGDLAKGEGLMRQAIELNPRVKYGEPYLRLGEAYASVDPEKAVGFIEQFREVYSSSCEAYFRLGLLYQLMNRNEDAKQAFKQTLDIYRSLPRYSRRQQRRWALLARLR